MKEIKMYESFDGLWFEKKEDCEKHETERIPKIQAKGVEWYDKDFKPLEMNMDNWDKVKFLKLESQKADLDFYNGFSVALDAIGKDQDEKFDDYCNINIWEKTLLIWDKDKEEWNDF